MKIVSEKKLNASYLPSKKFNVLKTSKDKFDVIIITSPFNKEEKEVPYQYKDKDAEYIKTVISWLEIASNLLNKNGSLLVYGIPKWLPYFAEFLYKEMTFKYWIVLKNSKEKTDKNMIQPYHEGVLLFVKRKSKLNINQVRYPHIYCSQCGDFIADWGGKKHLRHKFGPVISDVWDDSDNFVDDKHGLGPYSLERLLELTCKENDKVLLGMYDKKPYVGFKAYIPEEIQESVSESPALYVIERNPIIDAPKKSYDFPVDDVVEGDVVDVMSSWVSNQETKFDLIFADPPYNLEKNYGKHSDDWFDREYLDWCDKWLSLCADLLSPKGTLYVLNLPKWSFFHATLLNKKLWFQRWIAWDALSDPRGKVMPAHYGLLLYTKHQSNFTFNNVPPVPAMDQCLRPKCIAKRPLDVPREPLSDIWCDIHRIKHKRDRDEHPCQLPIKLLERVITISSKPGDLVLDPFMGTGTTGIAAKKLGRHFVGIDIDPKYIQIARTKVASVESLIAEKEYIPQLALL